MQGSLESPAASYMNTAHSHRCGCRCLDRDEVCVQHMSPSFKSCTLQLSAAVGRKMVVVTGGVAAIMAGEEIDVGGVLALPKVQMQGTY